MHIGLRLFIAFHCLKAAFSRQLSKPILNPDCPAELFDCSTFNLYNHSESTNNVIYTSSDNAASRIHALISTIDGISVLLVEADLNSTLDIDWLEFLIQNYDQSTIRIVGSSIRRYVGFAALNAFRYEDAGDLVDVEKSSKVQNIDLKGIFWSNATINAEMNVVTFSTSNGASNRDILGFNGTMQLSFQLFDIETYFNTMPHLLHNDQSAQLEISLIDLSPFSYNRTRYALELAFFAKTYSKTRDFVHEMSLDDVVTMNDENTPGIFETLILRDSSDDAYALWKPVCYYETSRELTSLSRVYTSSLKKIRRSEFNVSGLIAAYFGPDLFRQEIRLVNVSFGLSGDKFYPGFLIWTMQLGLGKPPIETFSLLIITLFSVCLSAPIGALVAGGWYGFRNRKRKNEAFDYTDDTVVVPS